MMTAQFFFFFSFSHDLARDNIYTSFFIKVNIQYTDIIPLFYTMTFWFICRAGSMRSPRWSSRQMNLVMICLVLWRYNVVSVVWREIWQPYRLRYCILHVNRISCKTTYKDFFDNFNFSTPRHIKKNKKNISIV